MANEDAGRYYSPLTIRNLLVTDGRWTTRRTQGARAGVVRKPARRHLRRVRGAGGRDAGRALRRDGGPFRAHAVGARRPHRRGGRRRGHVDDEGPAVRKSG